MKTTRFAIFLSLLSLVVSIAPVPAYALSGSDFQAGRIIDDSKFFSGPTMSVSDIQAFLNAKVPTCDTWGTQPYGGTTRAAYAASRGVSTPFICLKEYRENSVNKTSDGLCNGYTGKNESSAEIIYNVSSACGISVQVLLVLLQKEQALITDDWPWPVQYRTATGYGCPDTAACDTQYYGFFNQLYNAARQFKRYAAYPSEYGYQSGRNNFIKWHPDYWNADTSSWEDRCGGSTVLIQNQATAGLYNYTPYQPNSTALSNIYGSQDDGCSSYGNRNFWRLFNDWFGTTLISAYDYSFVSSTSSYVNLDYGQITDNSITIKNTGGVTWYADGAVPPGNTMTRLSVRGYGITAFADRWGDPNWLGSLTQIKMTPSVVEPGENATFNFKLRGPTHAYSQVINFVPVVDGVTFMKDINMQFVARSSLPAYKYVSSSFAPAQLDPGQKFTANVVLKNDGFGPWYADGAAPGKANVRLAGLNYTQNPFADTTDPNWLSKSQIRMTPAIVYPGQVATFTFNLVGPTQKQIHDFRFLPVLDGVAFLQDYGMAFKLSSPGKIYSYDFHAVSAPPSTMSPGQTVSTTLQLKNTGNTTWKNESTRTSTDTALRLVMMNPWYRLSPFRDASDSAWITGGQIAMLTPEVAPGQIGTFTFNWKAPAQKGTYLESFSPVADGVTGLQDKGMGYIVTVQ